MMIPKPIRDVIDFVLALPSAPDKSSASSVRALRERERLTLERWYNQRPLLTRYDSKNMIYKEEPLLDPECAATPGPRKTEERSRICNMRWANTTVLLVDTDFVRCRFFNCKLIDDGPFSMERCLMENCTIQSRDSHEKTSTPVRSVR